LGKAAGTDMTPPPSRRGDYSSNRRDQFLQLVAQIGAK